MTQDYRETEQIGRNLPTPEIDDQSIYGRALGGLQSALGTITQAPGIRQTLAGLETVASTAGGVGSAMIRAEKGVIEEQGFGGWAQELLTPWDRQLYRAKFDQIIGLDGQSNLRTTLGAAADWQRNRDSAFWGEKFLSEILFDPLTWVPVGAVSKVIGRAGRIAQRSPEQVQAIKARTMANIDDPQMVRDVTDIDKLTDGLSIWKHDHGWEDNALRGFASGYRQLVEKIPSKFNFVGSVLLAPFLIVNKSGLYSLRSTDKGVQASIRSIERVRQGERADGVIAGNLAYSRLLEVDKTFDVITRKIDGLDQQIVKNVTLKTPVAGRPKPILMGDVMEFPTKYNLTAGQQALVDEADKFLKAYFQWFKKYADEMKIPIAPNELVPDQRYWPRFIQMANEFEVWKRTGRLSNKKKPGTIEKRIFETFEQSTLGGHQMIHGSTMRPVTDILHKYANLMVGTVLEQGYRDDMLRIGAKNVMKKRQLVDRGVGSVNWKITNFRQQQFIIRRALAAMDQWQVDGTPPTQGLLDELRSLTPGDTSLARDMKKLINPYVKDRSGNRLYAADPTLLAKDKVSRSVLRQNQRYQQGLQESVASYKNTLRKLESNIDVDLIDTRKTRDELRKFVKGEQQAGEVVFPKAGFIDPEFNKYRFSKEMMRPIMPILATKDEILRQNELLQKIPGGTAAVSSAVGAAANIGGAARAFQLTYDLGVQFLQGATVLAASPRSWAKAVTTMLNSWNNPHKLLEYLSDPSTNEVLQWFGGRIQIVSTEFTEAIQHGTALNRAIGYLPILGRATEKFRTSFDAFGDAARIEMAKAFMPAIRAGTITPDQVANHVNKMTGISSSRALGIGALQREIEGAMISLAPNYLRATTGLLADAAQIMYSPYRFESQQALLALSKFFGGTVLLYTAICLALDQPIRLNPRTREEGGDGGAFMTVVLDGQRVGLGTKPYAIMRRAMSATMALQDGNQKEAAIELKNFFRGQTAPLTSSMWDILRGQTAIGEPVQTSSEIFNAGVSSRLMPFWAEAAINDDPRPSPFGTAADFVGLRSSPLSYRAMRFDVREELASRFPRYLLDADQKKFMDDEVIEEPTWDMLTKIQKGQIERGQITGLHPAKIRELQRFNEVIKERDTRIGPPKTRAYLQELSEARTKLEIETEKQTIMYQENERSTREVRMETANINREYGTQMEKIHAEDGPHEEYFQQIERDRQEKEKRGEFIPVADKAYQQYIDLIVSADDLNYYRGAAGYNYVLRDEREAQLRRIYGDVIIDNIQREFRENKKVGLLYRQYQLDRKDLEPYWEIHNNYVEKDAILRSLLQSLRQAEIRGDLDRVDQIKAMPRYKAINKNTRREKNELLRQMPRLDALLRFWMHTTTLQTLEAETLYNQFVRDAKAGILREF